MPILLPLTVAERNVIWQTNVVTDSLSGAFYGSSVLLVTPLHPTTPVVNAAHEGGFTLYTSVFSHLFQSNFLCVSLQDRWVYLKSPGQ